MSSPGILGSFMQQPGNGGILGDPSAMMPQTMAPWQSALGMLASGLKDAGAQLGGRPEDANSVLQYQQFMRQNQLRQAYATAATAQDPAARQQAYSMIAANGGDPSALMKMRADSQMPALLAAMQPNSPNGSINDVQVTPQASMSAPTPGGNANAPTVGDRLAAMGPTTSGLPLMGALKNFPELASTMAPSILNNQMEMAMKSVHPASLPQKQAGGYNANDPVMVDAYGNLSSPVKPQAAVTQGFDIARNTPRTPEDIAKDNIALAGVNKPIAVAPGSTLTSPLTGKPVGDQGGMPMAPGGKLSSNINDYPAQQQGVIRGMLNGTIAPPQGAALRSPQTLQLIEAAAAIDPSFDETKWTARNKMAGDALGNGSWGKAMTALGTATQHVAALGNYAGDTFSTTLPALNWALNNGASAVGSSGPTVYRDTGHKVGEEYTRAYRGAGGSETDIKSSMDALSPNASTRTKNDVIDENMNLARDKMVENVQQYNRTMGQNKNISDFVSPQTVAAYAARGIDINTGNKIPKPGASPNPATLPQKQAAQPSAQDIVNELRRRGAVK